MALPSSRSLFPRTVARIYTSSRNVNAMQGHYWCIFRARHNQMRSLPMDFTTCSYTYCNYSFLEALPRKARLGGGFSRAGSSLSSVHFSDLSINSSARSKGQSRQHHLGLDTLASSRKLIIVLVGFIANRDRRSTVPYTTVVSNTDGSVMGTLLPMVWRNCTSETFLVFYQ